MIIDELYKVLQSRKGADADESYVASLYAGGAEKMSAKIREEAEEVIAEVMALEGHEGDAEIREKLKNETADLIFHMWVMLAHYDIAPSEILEVLEGRFGTSGHDEKASRGEKS